MNPERAIVGLATVFGEPSVDAQRLVYEARHFALFAGIGVGLPLRLHHHLTYTPQGVLPEVGRATQFALLAGSPTIPAGLLALAYAGDHAIGDSILSNLERGFQDGGSWGLSLGCDLVRENGRIEAVVPFEVSLTTSPAYPRARVLGVGERALRVWELLAPPAPHYQESRRHR